MGTGLTVQPGCTKRRNYRGKDSRGRSSDISQAKKQRLGRLSTSSSIRARTGCREGPGDGWPHARYGQIARVLSGNDLRGFLGGSKPRWVGSRGPRALAGQDLQIVTTRAAKSVLAGGYEPAVSGLMPKQPRLRVDLKAYQALCKLVLARDNWHCQNCGATENLQVHHIQSRSHLGDDSLENLITLCSGCHATIHGNLRGGIG